MLNPLTITGSNLFLFLVFVTDVVIPAVAGILANAIRMTRPWCIPMTALATLQVEFAFLVSCHYPFSDQHSKSASICAIICSVLKWSIDIAPEGQAAAQVPQPLHSAVSTLELLLPFSDFSSIAL